MLAPQPAYNARARRREIKIPSPVARSNGRRWRKAPDEGFNTGAGDKTLNENFPMAKMMLFSGNAHPTLAQAIAQHLDLPLSKATVGKFSDGETAVEILENVRGKSVFIIQPTCAPTNDHLMELVIMADALHRASASRITAVVPYFGYARQDRRIRSARVPISAKIVADMICDVGFTRLLTVELHADQVQGFFDIPVDNVY